MTWKESFLTQWPLSLVKRVFVDFICAVCVSSLQWINMSSSLRRRRSGQSNRQKAYGQWKPAEEHFYLLHITINCHIAKVWSLATAAKIWVATRTEELEGLLWREKMFACRQPARSLLPPDWLCGPSLQEPLRDDEPCKMPVLQWSCLQHPGRKIEWIFTCVYSHMSLSTIANFCHCKNW